MPKAKRTTPISRNSKKKVKKSTKWSLDSIFDVNPNVYFRSHGRDRLVIMNVENAHDYYEITGLASRVFQAIDGKRSVSAIIKKTGTKQKSPDKFKANVEALFRDLLKEKLIQLTK